MGLGSLFGGGKKQPTPSAQPSSSKGPIKLRIAQPKPSVVTGPPRGHEPVPAFLSAKPQGRQEALPPMSQPVPERVADIVQTPLVTEEDLAGLTLGDIIVYKSGTCREITGKTPNGGFTVETTKLYSGDELEGQFRSGSGGVISLQDYLALDPRTVLLPNYEVAEGAPTEFTIKEIQRTGGMVTGVVFTFRQNFPTGFKADIGAIDHIQKE